jgi:hypothetical protein
MAPICLVETTHASPEKTSLLNVYILKQRQQVTPQFYQTTRRHFLADCATSGQFPPPGIQKGAIASQRDTSRTEDREDSSVLRYGTASVRNRIPTFQNNKDTVPSETSDVHNQRT